MPTGGVPNQGGGVLIALLLMLSCTRVKVRITLVIYTNVPPYIVNKGFIAGFSPGIGVRNNPIPTAIH